MNGEFFVLGVDFATRAFDFGWELGVWGNWMFVRFTFGVCVIGVVLGVVFMMVVVF